MPYAQLLQWAEAGFAMLGTEERCTGESARRMDDEFLFQELTTSNIETFSSHDVKSPYSLFALPQFVAARLPEI